MRPRCAQPSETVSSAALPHHIARVDHYCLALTLGYGPFRTLMNSTYSTAMSTVPGAHPMSGANVDFALTVSLSIITVCIGLFVASTLRPSLTLRRAGTASILALAAINLCSGIGALSVEGAPWMGVFLPAIYGLTSIVANTAWLVPFATLGAKRCLATLVTSILASSLTGWALQELATVPQAFALAAIGVVSAAILWQLGNVTIGNPARPSAYRKVEMPRADAHPAASPREALRRVYRLYGELWSQLVIYASLTMLTGFVTAFLATGYSAEERLMQTVASVGAALLVLCLAFGTNRVLDLRRLFSGVLPCIGLLLIVLPFLGAAYEGLFCAVLIFTSSVVNISFLFLLLETARVRQAPPVAAVAVSMIVARLCLSASLVAGDYLRAHEHFDDVMKLLLMVAIAIYLLSMTLVLLSRRRAGAGDAGFSVPLSSSEIAFNTEGPTENEVAGEGLSEGAAGGAGVDGAGMMGVREDAGRPGAGWPGMARAQGKAYGMAANGLYGATHEVDASMGGLQAGGLQAGGAGAGGMTTGQFEARSIELTAEYRLTPRERDVALLLAHGRTASYIGSELALSTNTVRGYMQEVYAKLGVHSKQELIDLFEG